MKAAIKPIETYYNGYRFRSRLEARWAVFFDSLGLNYEYEYDGYALDGKPYLPDFWIPFYACGCGMWIEIKPTMPTKQETEKAIRLCIAKQQKVCILVGSPWEDAYRVYAYAPASPESIKDFIKVLDDDPGEYEGVQWISPNRAIMVAKEDEDFFPVFMADTKRGFIGTTTLFVQCLTCKIPILANVVSCGCKDPSDCDYESDTPFLRSAYVSARQARFEHGEKPEPLRCHFMERQ